VRGVIFDHLLRLIHQESEGASDNKKTAPTMEGTGTV
jgi:hypothetical protein